MAKTLYVGNLAYATMEQDIQDLFQQAGTVVKCDLILDKFTSKSRGFAFVEMGSDEEAQKAVEMCNGQELDGRTLVVNEARPRTERGGGFGGGGGGYGGGDRHGGGGRGGRRGGGGGRDNRRGGGGW